MERFFNIAGPCVAANHYMLPATERLPEVDRMIRRGLCFVIYAQHTAETGQVFEEGALVCPLSRRDGKVMHVVRC